VSRTARSIAAVIDGGAQRASRGAAVNGIDFRQAIPDKPLVAGCGDAIPEHVRVVVSQDESAEDEEERYAAFGRIEKQTAAGQRVHPRDDQDDVIPIDEECRVKPDSGQARQFPFAHSPTSPSAADFAFVRRGLDRALLSWRQRSTVARAAADEDDTRLTHVRAPLDPRRLHQPCDGRPGNQDRPGESRRATESPCWFESAPRWRCKPYSGPEGKIDRQNCRVSCKDVAKIGDSAGVDRKRFPVWTSLSVLRSM